MPEIKGMIRRLQTERETYFENPGQPTPFIIYTDSSLKDVLFVPEAEVDGGKIKIDPADMKVKEISYGAEESPIKLAGEGSWGNYETLYLVQFNDLKKGRKLDKPIIYIMDIQHGENTVRKPVIDYTVNNQGDLQVNWEPVENASRYHVLKRYDMNHFYDNYKDLIGDALDHYFYYELHFEYTLLGTTTSATWTSADAGFDIAAKNYSEDDIASEESKDDLELIEQVEEEPRNYDLVILAENAQKGLTGLGEVLVLKEDGSTFDVPDAEVADSVADTDLAYVASSALEEYIVINMLEGNQYLDMAEFPEARARVCVPVMRRLIRSLRPTMGWIPAM